MRSDAIARKCPARSNRWLAAIFLATFGYPATVFAMGKAPDLCRDAARNAAAQTGVPYEVLMALALTETGRKEDGLLQPWPWAMHHDGQGFWPDSKAEAIAMAEDALQTGATNIDLGCFQINLRWHSQAFASLDDMLSPDQNAQYAAEFISDLYSESGDWGLAAGAYHSRNPENADRYRAKFSAILADLTGISGGPAEMSDPSPLVEPAPRINRFPLLQTGAPGGIGSLVPLTDSSTRLVGG